MYYLRMAQPTLRTIDPTTTVLELTGRLNVGTPLKTVETAIFEVIRSGAKTLILDCSELEYIDSASLGMLIGCAKDATAVGAQLRLAAPNGMVSRTLALTQMEKVIPIDPIAP